MALAHFLKLVEPQTLLQPFATDDFTEFVQSSFDVPRGPSNWSFIPEAVPPFNGSQIASPRQYVRI